MITKLMVYEAAGFDPYENLAAEQYLLEHLQPGECILYLWQNQNTVVIGRNQNAWAECRVSLLEQEGGKIARRLSGGGAVFHDLGNLNFTFIVREEDYDLDKQLSVIQRACGNAGVLVEKSGRNDLLAQGRKFSGNAFYHSQGCAYHHGTLLIRSDLDKLQRYLSPPKAKLEAKGVNSVRSRVVNLSQLASGLSVHSMKAYMKDAFGQVYDLTVETLRLTEDAQEQIAYLAKRNGSWEHLFGSPLPFTIQFSQRFTWGSIQLDIQAKGGVIQAARVYTDAMDWLLPEKIEGALTGCRFTPEDMQSGLQSSISDWVIREDLCQMLRNQEI